MPTSRRRASWQRTAATSARERDTVERRATGREQGRSLWRHLPDRGQATLTGGAYRVSVRLPVDATRANGGTRGRYGRYGAAPARSRPSGSVATPGPQATTPVNAARANGGTRGREWRHLPDRGQAADAHRRRRVSGGQHLPDRDQATPRAHIATPGPQATTPLNAARANVGPRGREWRPLPDRSQAADAHRRCLSCGQHLPDRGQAATLTGGADRVSVRLPDRSQGADVHRRGRHLPDRGSTCRIAARRLTLTGGAYRVSVRLPDRGQAATSPTSRRRGRWPQGRDFPRERGTGERGHAGAGMAAPAGSRPGG